MILSHINNNHYNLLYFNEEYDENNENIKNDNDELDSKNTIANSKKK